MSATFVTESEAVQTGLDFADLQAGDSVFVHQGVAIVNESTAGSTAISGAAFRLAQIEGAIAGFNALNFTGGANASKGVSSFV